MYRDSLSTLAPRLLCFVHSVRDAKQMKSVKNSAGQVQCRYCEQWKWEDEMRSTNQCRECYGMRNREHRDKYYQIYKEEHKEERREYGREYMREYYQRHKEELREKKKKYLMRRRHTDPQYRLRMNLKNRLWHALCSRGIRKNGTYTEEIIGCSISFLKQQLESQFQTGMSWDNYGVWVVDHIIPDSSFPYNSVDDPECRKCWNWENLQPLWEWENRVKSNRLDYKGGADLAQNNRRQTLSSGVPLGLERTMPTS